MRKSYILQKRPLGQSDLQLAPLMLGGNVFGRTADGYPAGMPGLTAPIASATRPEQVPELLKAPELMLSPDERTLLGQAGA
ncbi:hypothetical protein [Hymenobacter fastidiosus]|uniref:hypothetical protein n=1 Tax=Hymenobacter fastidiosus TaxID=486264 RepID=UPI0031ECF43B